MQFLVKVWYLSSSHTYARLSISTDPDRISSSASPAAALTLQKGCRYFCAYRAPRHRLNSATSFVHPWCLSYHLHPLACSTSRETTEMTALLETPAHGISTTFSPLSPVRGRRKGRDDFLGRKIRRGRGRDQERRNYPKGRADNP